MVPKECRYSKEHEWVRVDEEGVAEVGITDFAQEELGEVVFVELPDVGKTYAAGDEIGTIESVKAVAEVYTPVSGEIVEVNGDLESSPERVNEDPHGDGWLVRVRLAAAAELDDLMDASAYEKFVEGEAD